MPPNTTTTPAAPGAPAPAAPTVTTTPAPATPAPTSAAPAVPAADPAVPAVDDGSLPTDAPADGTPEVPVTTTPAGKVIPVPTAAMKQIKAEERERGRTQALAQKEEEAIAAGFSSHAEMLEFARNQKAQPAPAPAEATPAEGAPAEADPSPELQAAIAELRLSNEKLLEEKRKLNRARAREEKRSRQLQRQLHDMEATVELKLAAKDAGVQDVDYAVECFRRAIKDMPEEELKTVDEVSFFSKTLRQTHPHLYQAEERPVNTGAPNSAKPKPAVPTTKPAADGSSPGKMVDARSLSGPDFQKLLRERGLQNPATGGMLA